MTTDLRSEGDPDHRAGARAHKGVLVEGIPRSLPERSYGIVALAMLEGTLVTPEASTLSTM